jgi:chromate transporter
MRKPRETAPHTAARLPGPDTRAALGDPGLPAEEAISLFALGRIFLEVGATAFGGLGPALVIVERELVERRRLLTAADVAQAVAATRLLPGSALIQVMAFLGYRLKGWRGSGVAVAAGLLVPVTAMLALATAYDAAPVWPALGRAAHGMAAVVAGLFFASAYRLGRAVIRGNVGVGIALAAAGATAGLSAPAILAVVTGGLIGVVLLSGSETRPVPGTGGGGPA